MTNVIDFYEKTEAYKEIKRKDLVRALTNLYTLRRLCQEHGVLE
jgi:hypothetical protein